MNKAVYLTILFIFSFLSCVSAQKLTFGDFKNLQRGDKVKISIDYSSASIHGLTEDDFADYEKNWMLKKNEICNSFIAATDEELKGRLFLGAFKNAIYEIKVTVFQVNAHGDTKAEALLIDSNGTEIAKIERLNAKGGHWGTKLNLIKDGAVHTGEHLGKFLKKRIKK